ncbi:hypothetical protein [Flavobacterium cerinum]|uniref:Uncharacterized protein n=1 Tax=Flavobacterium cerinum TaxID=2502784 RepID=A0ABY5INK4_9FLAO|nr:hypothetical protein [Flavobacterium cerinum]UUC44430.1 hypothetical protein NOX80_12390 [Flavobacterium cerinum]
MKKIFLSLFFLFSLYSYSQTIKCEYDYNEKTDSTLIKKTPDYLIHENVFGTTSSFIFFSLVNSDGTPYLNLQILKKSKDFIKATCFNANSRIFVQLSNGKIVTLINSSDTNCSNLTYNSAERDNISIVNNYFLFSKDGYEDLKKYPISLIRVKFASETIDYVMHKELRSDTFKEMVYNPEDYFMNYLKCVE